jgi:hypothetical protein
LEQRAASAYEKIGSLFLVATVEYNQCFSNFKMHQTHSQTVLKYWLCPGTSDTGLEREFLTSWGAIQRLMVPEAQVE